VTVVRVLLLVGSALLALGVAGCGGSSEQQSAPAPPARQAPEIEGVTIDGKPLSLADLRGKSVFVNVWAAW
jgi:hypothetical protein